MWRHWFHSHAAIVIRTHVYLLSEYVNYGNTWLKKRKQKDKMTKLYDCEAILRVGAMSFHNGNFCKKKTGQINLWEIKIFIDSTFCDFRIIKR